MHTSSALPSDIEACYRWGANGYVVKSIGFDDFARQIGVILAYWLETNDVER